MKNFKKLFVSAFVLVGFATTSNAQLSATATATANIVSPITITKSADMSFGNIAVGTAAGTVVLPATASPIRTITGNITLPSTTGTISPASFDVTGQAGYVYNIKLPNTGVDLTLVNGTDKMTANAFVTNQPTLTGTLDNLGKQTFLVGATLNVNANQAAGTYISTGFTVEVNYN